MDLPCCSAPCWVDRYRVLPSFPSDLEAFLVITLYLVLPCFAVRFLTTFGFALLFSSTLGGRYRVLPSFTEFSIGGLNDFQIISMLVEPVVETSSSSDL